MPSLRRSALRPLAWLWILAVLALVLALTGCQEDVMPELVKVTDVVPREAEVGDRLEITGAGFPQGRTARVTFKGELRRPGERPRSASIGAEGMVTSQSRIELVMTDALEAAFCDRGDAASHTTFVGTIQVAFAGAARGAPPIAGVLEDATLDLRPTSVRAHKMAELTREGKATAAWLGVELEPGSGRLAVKRVAPGSVGARAGLVAGDSILSVDGLKARELADLATAEERAVQVRVLSGEPPREYVREVPVDGLHARIPRDLGLALGIVTASVLVALLLFAPLPWTGDLDERVGERLRRPLGAAQLAWESSLALARTPTSIARLATLAVLAIGLAVLGRLGIVVQGDVLGLCALSLGALLVAVAASAGSVPRAALVGREAWKLGALLVAAHAAGSLSTHEIVRGQGGLPWEWTAFSSPGLFGLAAIVCAHHVKARAAAASLRSPIAKGFAGAHDALTAVAVVTLLAGGWPAGAAAPAQAVVLAVKALAFMAVVAVLAAPSVDDPALPAHGSPWRRAGRAAIALGLPAASLCAAHAAWMVLPLGATVRVWVARALAAVVAALAVRFVVRVAHAAERRVLRADPWA